MPIELRPLELPSTDFVEPMKSLSRKAMMQFRLLELRAGPPVPGTKWMPKTSTYETADGRTWLRVSIESWPDVTFAEI